MSDENLNSESDGVKSLRDALEKANKEKADLAKRVAEFETAQRGSKVSEFLKSKSVDTKAASLYSGEDTSDEALNKWFEDYGSLFAPAGSTKTDAASDQAAANSDAAARIAGSSSGSHESPSQHVRPGQALPITGDIEQMQHEMATLPYEELVRRGWL